MVWFIDKVKFFYYIDWVVECFVVIGGNWLLGEVVVGGVKNSVFKFMVVMLLVEGISMIINCFDIFDVLLMVEVLCGLGVIVEFDGDVVWIIVFDELKYDVDFVVVW